MRIFNQIKYSTHGAFHDAENNFIWMQDNFHNNKKIPKTKQAAPKKKKKKERKSVTKIIPQHIAQRQLRLQAQNSLTIVGQPPGHACASANLKGYE